MSISSSTATDRVHISILGAPLDIIMTPERSGGACTVIEQSVPPGWGPPLHVHTREDETFYVMDGEITFTVGGNKIVAHAGDCLFAPRNIPHRFQNTSARDSKVVMFANSGNFGEFFMELCKVPMPPDPVRCQEIGSRFGITFLAESAEQAA